MDVYYMSDSIQYGSFRNPLYRDYEKFPYGTLESTLNSPPKSGGGIQQQNQQRNQTSLAGQGKSKGKSAKDSCPFCKEQKKRPLGAYMRKRGQRITTESISEDAEECAAEADEGSELQDDFEGASSSCSSPSGSPSAAELVTGEQQQQQQQHNHHHHRHGTGYGRQESQDSGCETK